MINRIALLSALALLASCNAARVVQPIAKDEVRVGFAMGGPQVNEDRLPLMSVYAVRGATEDRSDYLGLNLMTAGFQSLQTDFGSVWHVRDRQGWFPELNGQVGGNLFISGRDYATRLYPQFGMHGVWEYGRWMPYCGSEVWVDPFFNLVENGNGSLVHPSLHAGLRWTGKHFEFGLEGKWLNPTRTFVIPQQTVPTFMGTGARGVYVTLAYRIP